MVCSPKMLRICAVMHQASDRNGYASTCLMALIVQWYLLHHRPFYLSEIVAVNYVHIVNLQCAPTA
jgi:hypothetical protein